LLVGYLTKKFQSDNRTVNIEVSNRDDVRDYIDVRDVARAMVELQICSNSSREIVNISSSNPVSNIELIQNFEDITEKRAKINFTTPEKKVLAIWQDNSKIKELCDFTPKYSIKDSIKWCFSL
jgi:nucleoside-diphosphate-sugar epimerase